GNAELFALAYPTSYSNYGQLWLLDSSLTWNYLGGYYTGISATRDGHVYAVGPHGWHVYYLDSHGNGPDLGAPSPGGVPYAGSSLAASVGWFGGNEVFAIGPDAHIYVNSANGYGQWRLVDKSAQFSSLSATANDTVF